MTAVNPAPAAITLAVWSTSGAADTTDACTCALPIWIVSVDPGAAVLVCGAVQRGTKRPLIAAAFSCADIAGRYVLRGVGTNGNGVALVPEGHGQSCPIGGGDIRLPAGSTIIRNRPLASTP